MIDQVVIASDSNLNILYSNYHEKFYDRIMSKVSDFVDLDQVRLKCASKLDRCFSYSLKSLETESKTMRLLSKMFESIDFDSADEIKKAYYERAGVLKVLLAMDAYVKQCKQAAERKSMKQLNIESRRSQFSSMKLIVNYSLTRTVSSLYTSFSVLSKNSATHAGTEKASPIPS